MNKKVKKLFQMMIVVLLFTVVGERVEVRASVGMPSHQAVALTVSDSVLRLGDVDIKRSCFDFGKALCVSKTGADILLLHKKHTPTPTIAPKKNSKEEQEESNKDELITFIVLVIIAVAFFKRQKRKIND